MARRICVPVDAFGHADGALVLAGELSVTAGSVIRLVHIRAWEPPARSAKRLFLETESEALRVLDDALTGLWATGAAASGVVVDAPRALIAAAIAGHAEEWSADLLLVGRRRRTAIGALLRGSLANQLARKADCPVLIMHPALP